MITYQVENNLTAAEFISVLQNSTLGERRPIDDLGRIENMLKHANLIVTARDENTLIGVSRSLTDFSFCTYLSDLAVDLSYQKKGIGKELIRRTKLECPQAKIILLAAPKAIDYYPYIGMKKYEHCFLLSDVNEIM